MDDEANAGGTGFDTDAALIEHTTEYRTPAVTQTGAQDTAPSQPIFRISPSVRRFRKKHFAAVSDEEWNDWRWQLRNRIRSKTGLEAVLRLSREEIEGIDALRGRIPVSITPYYLALLDPDKPGQALRRTVIPHCAEQINSPCETADPLGEEGHTAVPGLVHRYPDRVLFLVTAVCSTYCRYCTRSRIVGGHASLSRFNTSHWELALDYIRSHCEVRDVLLSGGDPLTLSESRLKWLLSRLRRIRHVEIIRIGSKMPIVLPHRVTPALTNMLKMYHPIMMSLHCTHPDELTREAVQACTRLADAGIPLGSQTVLLKGINDSADIMKSLMHGLLKARVRPYYLYQCDPVPGSSHFRTPVSTGLNIIESLRGHTSGYAVPHYVIDAPGGGGKIPLQPAYVQKYSARGLELRNYEKRYFFYPDQPATD